MEEVIILDNINLTPLIKAKKAFDKAIEAPKTDLNRDATIQRFEFTFELSWKTLKRVLQFKGVIANNPRDVFREAAKSSLIDDPIVWFKFLENRNRTTHVYDENDAEEIYGSLSGFKFETDQLLTLLRAL